MTVGVVNFRDRNAQTCLETVMYRHVSLHTRNFRDRNAQTCQSSY